MKPCLCVLALLFGVSVPVLGQRLPPDFGTPYEQQLVFPDPYHASGVQRLDRPRECGARPILIAAGALGGAVGGYVGYEILWGIWPGDPRGFWGHPFRTTLVVSGAMFGAIGSARRLSRTCAPWAGA